MKPLRAGALYFAWVFGAGFVLGTIRVLLLVPRLGVRVSELVEMPLMLLVMLFAARWVVRRYALASRQRLATGAIALGLLLLAEISMVWLQGLTLAQWIAGRDPVSGPVYGAMLVLFALLPWLVARR
ncbi:MAG: hypothetical protein KJ787_14725 [Gammaproteobacteria bacterium]|nr:hypothetical protein [Gammaproteobacteria bacterium]MBU1647583.1 hypothetical protein [Gammaproteobacteria bacterium]MBU1971472.1 hypothetical protein [Gammaproteobacteria bacterium]